MHAASTAHRTPEAHFSVSRPSGRLEQPVVSRRGARRRPREAAGAATARARAPRPIDPVGRVLAPRAPRVPGRGERIAVHPRRYVGLTPVSAFAVGSSGDRECVVSFSINRHPGTTMYTYTHLVVHTMRELVPVDRPRVVRVERLHYIIEEDFRRRHAPSPL